MQFITRDKEFYRSLVLLMIPISLQRLITFGITFADNVMIGSLGDSAVSGVYVSNQMQTLQTSVILALETSLMILGSQYWGKKDTAPIRSLISIAVRFGVGFSLLLTIVSLLFPENFIRFFTKDETTIRDGSIYLRIIAVTFIAYAVSQIMIAAMRSVETARTGLYISMAALVINVSLNYILIFGKLGFPAMGIRGAAIATLISRVSEALLATLYILFADKKLNFRMSDFLHIDRTLMKDFIRYGLPVIGGQVVWACNLLFNTRILGSFDNAGVITATSIVGQMQNMVFMWTVGLSSAAGIITGKTIGAGEFDKMKVYARTIQILFLVIGILSGGLVLLIADPFISLYNVSSDAVMYAHQFAILYSIIVIGQTYQGMGLAGLVKSGGDTAFVFKNDTIFVFLVVMPLTLFARYRLNAAPAVVYMCLRCDELLKCIVAFFKINSFNWMKNLTRDTTEEAAA
ncbi:MAG: MATE family efflux transporter [Lachnospiraceae bacterium]|nr:MATE family efflux transporter [Lachnospiraceae bacterium]